MTTVLNKIQRNTSKPTYEDLTIQLEQAQEEIKQLREFIIPKIELPECLDIHKKQREITLIHYRFAPSIIPHTRLMELLYPDGNEPEISHVTRMIYLTKKKLNKYNIDLKTEYGIGRYMPLESAKILNSLRSQQI